MIAWEKQNDLTIQVGANRGVEKSVKKDATIRIDEHEDDLDKNPPKKNEEKMTEILELALSLRLQSQWL